jgi:hypothetical protein
MGTAERGCPHVLVTRACRMLRCAVPKFRVFMYPGNAFETVSIPCPKDPAYEQF